MSVDGSLGALTVAVAQPECMPGDVVANGIVHGATVDEANADLIVFPELSLCGYDVEAPLIGPSDEALDPIVAACNRRGSVALVGAATQKSGLRYISTLVVTSQGVDVAYSKMFLGGDETRWFSPGHGPRSVLVAGWRIGVGICKDTRILEHVNATLSLGIDCYVAGLVHGPGEVGELDERATAITGQGRIPVGFASAAGRVGRSYPDTPGCSAIWGANGAELARSSSRPGDTCIYTLESRSMG